MKESAKKRKALNVLSSVFYILVIVAIAALETFLSLDGDFEWVKITSKVIALFIVRVLLIYTTYLFTYNKAFQTIVQNVGGEIYRTIEIYRFRAHYISANKLRPQLKEAVKRRNYEFFCEEATAMLHEVTSWLDYEEIEKNYGWDKLSDNDIEFLSEKMSTKRGRKRLRKTLVAIRDGEVACQQIKAENLISQSNLDYIATSALGKKMFGKVARGHILEGVSGVFKVAVCSTFIISNISMSGALMGVISTVLLLASGISSGIAQGYSNANYMRCICRDNNEFFEEFMGIAYKPDLSEFEDEEDEKPVKRKIPLDELNDEGDILL